MTNRLVSMLFGLIFAPFYGAIMAAFLTPILFLIGAAFGLLPMSWHGVFRCWASLGITFTTFMLFAFALSAYWGEAVGPDAQSQPRFEIE